MIDRNDRETVHPPIPGSERPAWLSEQLALLAAGRFYDQPAANQANFLRVVEDDAMGRRELLMPSERTEFCSQRRRQLVLHAAAELIEKPSAKDTAARVLKRCDEIVRHLRLPAIAEAFNQVDVKARFAALPRRIQLTLRRDRAGEHLLSALEYGRFPGDTLLRSWLGPGCQNLTEDPDNGPDACSAHEDKFE